MSFLIRVPTSHHREASQHVKCKLAQQGYQSSTLLDCCVSNTLICKSDPSEAKPLEYQKKYISYIVPAPKPQGFTSAEIRQQNTPIYH